MDQEILVRNGFIAVPSEVSDRETFRVSAPVATIISNLASYGYVIDRRTLDALMGVDKVERWWKSVETVLKTVTGADRNMGDHIVYKNFPKEVLDMDSATQVFHQILIYLGIPYDLLREEEEPRAPLGNIQKLKVLTLADDATPTKIFANLKAMRNRWSDNQTEWAEKLLGDTNAIVFSDFGFKENAVHLATKHFAKVEIVPSSATDVLRLAAALSGQDISLRERVRFRGFKRAERRRLLAALDQQTNLENDFAARPDLWKRMMEHLRPGDYKGKDGRFVYANVVAAYNDLYLGQTKSFAALVDPQVPTEATLETLVQRPGEYMRRFHYFYKLFGQQAVDGFVSVMDKLSSRQLVGFRAYLRTINDRTWLISPPKSSWPRAKVRPNEKAQIERKHLRVLDGHIAAILSKRNAELFPEGIALDLRVDQIKLQTNDQKLAEFGRGTSFDIPEDVTFLRSASYWAFAGQSSSIWYDNGWNFFDQNWSPMGTVAWNAQHYPYDSGKKGSAAVYSGDPSNKRDLKGRACQMADLYLDRLDGLGVRYAVWNILCYSKRKFSEAEEVLATLQMGADAQTGKTYEPSRAQMVFPLKAETYSSFVAYIDVKRRKLVYMDAALPANVTSAGDNSARLQEMMPAYVEYLDSLPTVLELLQDAPQGTMPVLFDDVHTKIDGGRAFVFQPENSENTFDRVSLTDLQG